ncbi:RNA 2',3'-cyclic phosphodiesterase [bacterium]|nr:RNA 2',3'-cyclic phosphodiesterase [bacterium]
MGVMRDDEKIRSFFAIELPEDIRRYIERDIVSRLKKVPAKVKWVARENMHLTVRFLGEISRRKVDEIVDRMFDMNIQERISVVSLSLSEIGTFGRRNPRVIWLGLSGEVEKIVELHGYIERVCDAVKLPADDKKFSPHITIGRVKSPSHTDKLLAEIKKLTIKQLDFMVKEVILFKSTLTPSGPIYSVIEKFPFRN